MDHPIKSGTRLVAPPGRYFRKFFMPDDPRGWADYHIVPERRGTLWIHCHGARRRIGADLEFVAVPPELRPVAIELLFALIRQFSGRRAVAADAPVAVRPLSKAQAFAHVATLRAAPRTDKRHQGILRIVDHEAPMNAGYPYRLFATHLVAKATRQADTKRKESLYRRAIDIFPGDFAGDEGTVFDPSAPDLTALQNRSNLAAYLGMAEILRTQRRMGEAAGFLEPAIARCPTWAMAYREHLLQSYSADDPYLRYWKDVNIGEITVRRQSEEKSAQGPAASRTAPSRPGFGRRPRGVSDFF